MSSFMPRTGCTSHTTARSRRALRIRRTARTARGGSRLFSMD
jgi:hypothetical protein